MKQNLKRVFLGLLLLVLIYGVGRFIVVAYDSWIFVERQPYLVMQTANSITIKWQTDNEEVGEVLYALKPLMLVNKINETQTTKKHLIKISNLIECTRYYYKVISDSLIIDNTDRTFTTLCEIEKKQRLWIVGDSGEIGQGQEEVYNSMLNFIDHDFKKLSMWLLLGDNAYRSGTQKQYNEKLFEPYKDLIKRFVPWAVIGNHDARRWAFYDIWEFPENAETGGLASNHEEFYSIDNGNLHLIMLDSETVSLSENGDMAIWLKKDLAQNKKPWVIVSCHTPPYTDGSHTSNDCWNSRGRMCDMRENFVPIFDEFGVDLVLSGHSHGYERSKLILNHLGKSDTFKQINILQDRKTDYIKSLREKKNSGTIYQVCGSSAKLGTATYNHPALPYSIAELGSLIIELTQTTLTSKFLNIDGTIADEFTITKIEKK